MNDETRSVGSAEAIPVSADVAEASVPHAFEDKPENPALPVDATAEAGSEPPAIEADSAADPEVVFTKQARAEWATNANRCKQCYQNEVCYVVARKRELAEAAATK